MNIESLVKRIHGSMKAYEYELIVVDDDSPDKTGEIVQKLSFKYPVTVFTRNDKKGLASAVINGFSIAKGDIIGVIDADLSHPPEIFPDLVEILVKRDLDIVVASRLVEGGGTEDWPRTRKITSFIAAFLAIGLTKVKDPMSGYFVLNKRILKNANLVPRGYKILLEILVKCRCKKVYEYPFIFKDRTAGKSKVSLRVNIEYLKQVFNLYLYKLSGIII